MTCPELSKIITQNEVDSLEEYFRALKTSNLNDFNKVIDQLKVLFILSNDVLILNKIALIFNEFKIHSSVSAIVAKILSSDYLDNGGTLIYSLSGLKKGHFLLDLSSMWQQDISYEMEQMLFLIGVPE